MSAPKMGDVVLVLDANSVVVPAIVETVTSGTVLSVLYASGGGWGHDTGLTEVADEASLTTGTWCRRAGCP